MTGAGRMGPLLRVGWIVVALVLAITVINLAYVLTRPGPYRPWGKVALPFVLSGKTVRAGGLVVFRGDKCVVGTEPIPFTIQSYWARMDGARIILPFRTGGGVYDPKQAGPLGCFHYLWRWPIDPAMTSGLWRLEGQTCAQRNTETACQGWYTQTFRVIGKEILNP